MREKELGFLVAFALVLFFAIGTSKLFTTSSEIASTTSDSSEDQPLIVTQLEEEGREKSATMVLVGSPPMQPSDHIERWNPDLHHESCMACHSNPTSGAPTPPKNHFYNEDMKDKIFRDNCQQCHATQNDTKTAFKSK
jgi:nitrate reductase (cytochrome), electron transfer subunit